MSKSVTSIYAFSKSSGIPRTTVIDKVTELGWASDKGLSESQVAVLLDNFSNHPKLKVPNTGSTPPQHVTKDDGGYALTTREPADASQARLAEMVSTPFDCAPIEVLEPIQFLHRDTSEQRASMAISINQRLQQMESNRQAIEAAVIAEAEQRGAELALRAHQAQQAAFTTVQSGLTANAAEILGLLKKQ